MKEQDNDGNVESRDHKKVKDTQLLQERLIGHLQDSLLSQEYTADKFECIGRKVVLSKGVKFLDISEEGTQESPHGMVTYSFYLKRRFEAYSMKDSLGPQYLAEVGHSRNLIVSGVFQKAVEAEDLTVAERWIEIGFRMWMG